MIKKVLSLLLPLVLCAALIPSSFAADSQYSDIPADSWAIEEVASASRHGLIEGIGGGLFGYGQEITRAQLATLLCRMFGWDTTAPDVHSFLDVQPGAWYYEYVETARANDAFEGGGNFRPDEPATREEMAVMLVRGLGYKNLAAEVEKFGAPFTDVTSNAGYIAIARDIDMTKGAGGGLFLPNNTAKREEAAAMLVRVYEKYISKTAWIHGFYAFSSYGQRQLASEMDAVSFGWSSMLWDTDSGASLNTSSRDGNEWRIPEEYNLITEYLEASSVPAHLNVFMNTSQTLALPGGAVSNTLRELLRSSESREQAVKSIIDEVTREYSLIVKNPYSGVTVDFEGLFAADRENFTAFLELLSKSLREQGMTLYVAVHAALPDGQYYDGYDYRAIGNLADKVILMAHDYSPTNLEGYVGEKWHENTPVTPFAQVYYALRAITDSETGVSNPAKVALAISFSPVAWELDSDGLLASAAPSYPTTERLHERMRQDGASLFYSDQYRNAYLKLHEAGGHGLYYWYEDARSVSDKLALARLFGVTGVSVWRLGQIPDYEDYTVLAVLR